MSPWKTLQGRVSLLASGPGASPSPSALDVFRKVWHSDPDGFKKPANPLLASTAHGRHKSFTATCSVAPNRIDFNLTPAPDDPSRTTFQTIEDGKAAHDELVKIIDQIGKTPIHDGVNRVAVFAQFVSLQPGSIEANQAILAAIPEKYRFQLGDEQSFALQLNSPVPVPEAGNTKLNILTKWSVERFQVVVYAVPAEGVAHAESTLAPHIAEFIGASVSFDNNCMPEREPLTPERQGILLRRGLAEIRQRQMQYGLKVEGF